MTRQRASFMSEAISDRTGIPESLKARRTGFLSQRTASLGACYITLWSLIVNSPPPLKTSTEALHLEKKANSWTNLESLFARFCVVVQKLRVKVII
jgi:hypothetical protein